MQRAVMKRQKKRKDKPALNPVPTPGIKPGTPPEIAKQNVQEYSQYGGQGHRESHHAPDHGEHEASDDEEPAREFPVELYDPSLIKHEEIEAFDGRWVFVACPQSPGKCPHCGNHVFHTGCLVVSICGALSKTGTNPRSSIGIFFGRHNKKNLSVELDGDKHTSQTAELKACLEALTRSFVLHTNWQMERPKDPACHPLHTLVVKSDSEYVVRGAMEWLPKWKENGWKKSSGQPVANAELWRIIDAILKKLEYDIKVQFWLVPREMNQIATEMAKAALGGA